MTYISPQHSAFAYILKQLFVKYQYTLMLWGGGESKASRLLLDSPLQMCQFQQPFSVTLFAPAGALLPRTCRSPSHWKKSQRPSGRLPAARRQTKNTRPAQLHMTMSSRCQIIVPMIFWSCTHMGLSLHPRVAIIHDKPSRKEKALQPV